MVIFNSVIFSAFVFMKLHDDMFKCGFIFIYFACESSADTLEFIDSHKF